MSTQKSSNVLAIHDVLHMSTCSSSLDSVQDGCTALMAAAQNGHCEVVRMLLEAKADVNSKTNVSDIYCMVVCVQGLQHKLLILMVDFDVKASLSY